MDWYQGVKYALSEEEPTTDRLQGSDLPVARLPFLTPREEEVATLVAQGLTNRQIAARLVISEATAETHLARIFKKLDLHSRTQLTIWLKDRGFSSSR